jgi:hypothetical protein
VTGEKFAPTWEPKEYLTEAAIADWEALKLARQASMSSKSPSSSISKGASATFYAHYDLAADKHQNNRRRQATVLANRQQHLSRLPQNVAKFDELCPALL